MSRGQSRSRNREIKEQTNDGGLQRADEDLVPDDPSTEVFAASHDACEYVYSLIEEHGESACSPLASDFYRERETYLVDDLLLSRPKSCPKQSRLLFEEILEAILGESRGDEVLDFGLGAVREQVAKESERLRLDFG